MSLIHSIRTKHSRAFLVMGPTSSSWAGITGQGRGWHHPDPVPVGCQHPERHDYTPLNRSSPCCRPTPLVHTLAPHLQSPSVPCFPSVINAFPIRAPGGLTCPPVGSQVHGLPERSAHEGHECIMTPAVPEEGDTVAELLMCLPQGGLFVWQHLPQETVAFQQVLTDLRLGVFLCCGVQSDVRVSLHTGADLSSGGEPGHRQSVDVSVVDDPVLLGFGRRQMAMARTTEGWSASSTSAASYPPSSGMLRQGSFHFPSSIHGSGAFDRLG